MPRTSGVARGRQRPPRPSMPGRRPATALPAVVDGFAEPLLAWFDGHGRHDLPWQRPRTPYRVWLSEIMLQQTQVATVMAYFARFVASFPDLATLANAGIDDVLALWSGLGYYSRARNLHRAARICVERHGGELPEDFDALLALPGIGRSTAGAIMAQAFQRRFPILDGNVKRVLARYHGIDGWPGESRIQTQLWRHADAHTPATRVADYTQAIMDLGAFVCMRGKPRCDRCPLAAGCIAHRDGRAAALPARKPARQRPVRRTLMLVLRDVRGRVLLERRPPTGIWAGLWSLPEAGDEAAAHGRITRETGRAPEPMALASPPAFTHDFSHYRLEATPLAFAVSAPRKIADGDATRWLYPAEAALLGLPAPIRRLLASLR